MQMYRDIERFIQGDIQYHRVLNAMADGIHLVDRDLVIIWANDVYIEWLAKMILNANIIGLTVREATPFLPEIVFDEYRRALLGDTVITAERILLPDGKFVDTETRKIPIVADGHVCGVITVLRDVTAQNRQRIALQDSERQFRRFLETIDLIAVGLDLDGNIVFCNDHTLSLCGWERDEVMGRNWFDLFIPPDTARVAVQAYHSALTHDGEGVPLHFNNQILTRDGRLIDVSWSNTVLCDISGKVIGTASIGEDVTERNRLNDMLVASETKYRLSAEQLEASNDELRRYSHVVSHELRSPLNSIRKMAHIVQEDYLSGRVSASTISMLGQMVEKTRWATGMIDEVLRYSEIGHTPLQILPTPFGDILPEVTNDVDVDDSVELRVKEEWPIVFGDPALIRQIFRNLIENGIKFNESNPKRVELSWERDQGGHIIVTVSDNGLGIAPEMIDHIFEPYVRSGDYSGTGMGLAIVWRACKRLGVPITVESEVGRGTAFHLVFEPGDKASGDEM